MKKLVLCLIILLTIIGIAYAEEITLPNGTKLNIDELSDYEITQAIKTAQKSMAANKNTITNIVKSTKPEDLDVWRKLITGTIKDVCSDLNVTVNDFVKTPVGMGVAALIIYKVAGKNLLSNALDIIIMIPLWFIVTGGVLFFTWKFFSFKTYYNKIYYDDKGKKVKEGVKREMRYNWNSEEAKCIFAGCLIGIEVLITLTAVGFIL